MESYLAILTIVFKTFRIEQKFKKNFIIFLLAVHLCTINGYPNLVWETSIIHDTPSQDDDKSSQEKKK
jgi:hypothetical protein